MCDSMCCVKNHNIVSTIDTFDLIISYNEMISILECLVDECLIFCEQCKNCNECRKLSFFIESFTKMDLEVRQKPKTLI